MTAPEKIWVEIPDIFDGMGFWQEQQSNSLVEYTRSAMIPTVADIARLTDERDGLLRVVTDNYVALRRAEASEAKVAALTELLPFLKTADNASETQVRNLISQVVVALEEAL
jgi:hypothetical protein